MHKYEAGRLTQDKILGSAKEIFLQKGYAGASMAKIAEKVGVPKSLIYHHFKNKEALWHGVKNTIVAESLPDLPSESARWESGESLRDYVRKILEMRFDVYMKHPDVAKLVSWQIIENNEETLSGDTAVSPSTWVKQFERMQLAGIIRQDISVNAMVVMMNGMISIATTHQIKNRFGRDLSRFLSDAVELVCSAVQP